MGFLASPVEHWAPPEPQQRVLDVGVLHNLFWKAANKSNCLVGFNDVFDIVRCRGPQIGALQRGMQSYLSMPHSSTSTRLRILLGNTFFTRSSPTALASAR